MRMNLTGISSTVRRLKGMKQSIQNRILARALRAGSRPIIMAARQNAPRKTGLTAKSLGMVLRRNRRRTSAYVVMGPRSDHMMVIDRAAGTKVRVKERATAKFMASLTPSQRLHIPAKVAHLVEGGHGGVHRARPHPFMRPALEAQKQTAEARIASVIREEIQKEARR